MEKVRIIVDEETLELFSLHRVSGATLELTSLQEVSGVIHVQLYERSFPSEHWDDLCAGILAMWLSDVNRYILGLDEVTTLYFMDGDYALKLIRQSNQRSVMRFLEPNEVCVMEIEVDVLYFARQLLAASAKIVDHFPQHQNILYIQEVAELADVLRSTLRSVTAREKT